MCKLKISIVLSAVINLSADTNFIRKAGFPSSILIEATLWNDAVNDCVVNFTNNLRRRTKPQLLADYVYSDNNYC